ncbi:nitrogen fixation/metabolism regulation signal transduction histidine kinase [Povalibacter uvarum]|uniref:histidine kinase n=1 Tax=Povalibacter uvarum TaxID=732238 RepID=A0A841HUU8_9GAMM|nr:ATP-binding protein [Povalibacter uvarum]MBB6096029.1 nitrogen fixation/metabolism regulation signal transduction histidine kinase [Povalibacter uvarum]
MQFSLEGRFALLFVVLATAVLAAFTVMFMWLGSLWIAAGVALLIGAPLSMFAARLLTYPITRTVQAISDGIVSMRDRDFSVSITPPAHGELTDLVESYNGLGALLRSERQGLYQRELLLDTVIQATPLSMVLTNAADRVVYSNVAARQTFLGGRKLEGLSFTELLTSAPEPLRQAVASEGDTLFTIDNDGESEIYHLSKRGFLLNSQMHRLFLLKQLTRELSRQEVETWKKVIRVIAHELNNSLAPISSLAHSGRQLAVRPEPAQLERVFRTIEERAKHLHSFIDGYARFAKLPRPRPEEVDWSAFLRSLQDTSHFRLGAPPPARTAVFDPTQMEQVLINLVKNAKEAGAPPESIDVEVQEHAGGWRVQVLDRGTGMTDEVLRGALLPFYSTKPSGAGLGLTICREVVEAHGGRLSLANRPDGGLVVTLWIPTIEQTEGKD